MSAYLLVDGKKQGPYSIDQLKGFLSSNAIPHDTLSWQEGMTEWQPLAVRLSHTRPQHGPILPTRRHPGLGIASFTISLAGVFGWFILLLVAGAASASGASDTHPLMIATGLCLFLGLGLNLLGTVFGIVVLPRPHLPKTLTIIGITLNLVEMVGIGLLSILGMASNS
jgi:hypothetical protein